MTKDVYTKLEVIEILVSNNNQVIKLIDKSKYYAIEDNMVRCYRKRKVLKDTLLSEYTFDYCIKQALGEIL